MRRGGGLSCFAQSSGRVCESGWRSFVSAWDQHWEVNEPVRVGALLCGLAWGRAGVWFH